MPFIIRKTDQCPASRPYGVLTETGHQTGKTVGKPHGCFPSQAKAREQQAALYANVPDARSEAPLPPNLRDSTSQQKRCGTCHMFDAGKGVCWGYGNRGADDEPPVTADTVCDSWAPESSETKSADTLEVPRMDPSTITDASGLLAAILPIARAGEFYDDKRLALVKRAGELGHPDLLPDNWNSDGTLASRDGVWETSEQRDTYNDMARALSDALGDSPGYCYLIDFDQTNVYYMNEGCICSAPYTVEDDGPVTIGEGQRVRPVTTYVPAKRAEADAAEEKRSLSHVTNLVEYRRDKAQGLSRAQRRRPDERPCMAPLELRAENPETGVRVLRSYASLFDTPYTIRSSSHRYDETVRKGAFKRSLAANPEVVLRLNHTGAPLAATWNNTLRLGEDDKGLWYEADLQVNADHEAASLAAKIDRGDLRESSFAFRCIDDNWSDDFTKRDVTVAELDRGDVAVVTFGASRATAQHMTLRSEEVLEELRDLGGEALLSALVEWRDYTLIPVTERAGKVLSSDSLQVLTRVLGLVNDADEAVDEALPLLADLMGVPNPDEDKKSQSTGDTEQTGDERAEGDGDAAVDLYDESEDRKALTTKARNNLPDSDFVFPKDRRYPIQDISHARNALARSSGKPEEAAVKRAVYKRYPSLKPSSTRAEESVVLVPNDSEELRFDLVMRSIS